MVDPEQAEELVRRLRQEGRVYTHMEAADMIERLLAENDSLRAAIVALVREASEEPTA